MKIEGGAHFAKWEMCTCRVQSKNLYQLFSYCNRENQIPQYTGDCNSKDNYLFAYIAEKCNSIFFWEFEIIGQSETSIGK